MSLREDFERVRRELEQRSQEQSRGTEMIELPAASDEGNASLVVVVRALISNQIGAHNAAERVEVNKLSFVKEIVRVYPPDETGEREVLYLDTDGHAQTAYVRITKSGGECTIAESW